MTDKSGYGIGSRTHKPCDACKFRKVRCPSGPPGPCTHCIRRKEVCHFSVKRLAHRRNVAGQLLPVNYSPSSQPAPSPPDAKAVLDLSASDGNTHHDATGSLSPKSPPHCVPYLHVDRVIERALKLKKPGEHGHENNSFFPRNGLLGGRNSLTFFSESRLLSLSTRLRNQKVNDLVGRISMVVNSRLHRADPMTTTTRKTEQPELVTDRNRAAFYIRLYFDRVHPMLPFLDKPSFEATISTSDFRSILQNSKPWACLYHAVLALGSQYADGGSFEPGKGESWRLFSVSLSGFSDLLVSPDSIITLQALTAMSAYGLSISGLAIQPVIMSEAARRAQVMSGHNFSGPSAHAFQKAFWTMYAIEKITSFHFGRSSTFVDSDIDCPIPVVPEATIGEFNWFLQLVRLARLFSRAYTSLFSVGVSGNSNPYYLDVLNQMDAELEAWQASLPDNGFRPGGSVRPQAVSGTLARAFALLMHYLYYSLLLTLSRTTLAYLTKSEDADVASRRCSKMKTISTASRCILELTAMIEVEPYTITWILAGIPTTALFVLFDMVIHDPRHPDTASNLTLLDMVADHFCSLEHASGGTLPGSLIAEFSKIARDYVDETQNSEPWMVLAPEVSAAVSTTVPQTASFELEGGQQAVDTSAVTTGLSDGTTASQPVSSSPLHLEFGDFPFNTRFDQVSTGAPIGTDVMGIFSYFLPDLDPMFYQGTPGQNELLFNGGSVT